MTEGITTKNTRMYGVQFWQNKIDQNKYLHFQGNKIVYHIDSAKSMLGNILVNISSK